jgi:hypothetical protein
MSHATYVSDVSAVPTRLADLGQRGAPAVGAPGASPAFRRVSSVFGQRVTAVLAWLVITSLPAHLQGSGRSAMGQGGPPHRTNDLDPWLGLLGFCLADGDGRAGFHLSHPATSTRRQASIPEPEVAD